MQKKNRTPMVAAVIAALVVAAIATAQSPGLGVKKDTTLQGTGSSGSPIGVNTTTLAGSGLDKTSTTLFVGAGTGITVGTDTVSVDTSVIQSRVSGSCAAGSAIRAIDATGAVTCETYTDTDTTYTAGDGLSLTGTEFAVDIEGASCSAGQYVSALSSTGAGTCTAEVGDISAVTASTGLSGGGTSGAVSLAVDYTATQRRVSGTCSAGSSIRAIAADGTVTCEADDTGITNGASANVIPKSDGTNLVASQCSDDGTTTTCTGNFTGGDATTDTHTFNGRTTINSPGVSGSGRNDALRINAFTVGTIGDSSVIHWSFNSQDVYNVWAGAEVSKTTPAFLNPRFVVAVQDHDTTGTENVTKRWAVTNAGAEVTGTLSVTGKATVDTLNVGSLGAESLIAESAGIQLNADVSLSGTLTANSTSGSEGEVLTIVGGVPKWASGGGPVVQTSSSNGNIDDLSLDDDTTVLVHTGTTAVYRGIAGGYDGRVLQIVSSGTGTIGFSHQAGTSTTANRFQLPDTAWTVASGSVVTVVYDGSVSRWRIARDQRMRSVIVETTATINGNTTIGDNVSVDTLTLNSKINSHVYYTGTAPTITSCGTGATIAGNDRRGAIDVGSGNPANCTITFAGAYTTNAPVCVVSSKIGTATVTSVSTSAVTFSATDMSGEQILYYHCDGIL